jgi:hypothetical protein
VLQPTIFKLEHYPIFADKIAVAAICGRCVVYLRSSLRVLLFKQLRALRHLGLKQFSAPYDLPLKQLSAPRDLCKYPGKPHGDYRKNDQEYSENFRDCTSISALAPSAEPIGLTPVVAPAGPPADTAERRQVTVMFADLVGSTALSARMDPEDLREVISAYQKCAAEAVRRFGGFVARYMGDGVLVYFGYKGRAVPVRCP